MLQRFLTIAHSTFVETVRQPIYGVLLFVTALLSILNVSLAGFTLGDDDKLLLDLGLSTLLLSGLFLAAFSATGVISREIENKTVLTVISKPISRPVFILGKFGGLFAAMLVASYLGFLVFVLAIRHGVLQTTSQPWDAPVLVFGFGSLLLSMLAGAFCNYFYGANFPTTVLTFLAPLLTVSVLAVGKLGKKWEVIDFGSSYVSLQVVMAAYLVFLAITVTTAIAVAASTRFGQVMTLVICTVALGVGVVSDYAFGQHADTSMVAAVAYRAFPNIGPFWVIDGLTSGSDRPAITWTYVGYVTTYAGLVTAAILSLAVAAFQKREVG